MTNPMSNIVTLLPADSYVNLHQQVAKGKFGSGGKFSICQSINGDAFYIFTDHKHPDGDGSAIYVFPGKKVFNLMLLAVEEMWKEEGK